MGKLANILTMLQLLSNNRKYNISELSEKLEVTPRMIRFYKEELEKAGIYIDTIRGPYGGYVLNNSIRIPVRRFSRHDISLLKKIKNDVDSSLESDFMIFFDKVKGVYQGSKEEKRELELDEKSIYKYNILNRAIKERKKVKLLYFSYNKGENERIIYPYDMFLYKSGWGVAAYCELRNDIRHFELKRIVKIHLLDEYYE